VSAPATCPCAALDQDLNCLVQQLALISPTMRSCKSSMACDGVPFPVVHVVGQALAAYRAGVSSSYVTTSKRRSLAGGKWPRTGLGLTRKADDDIGGQANAAILACQNCLADAATRSRYWATYSRGPYGATRYRRPTGPAAPYARTLWEPCRVSIRRRSYPPGGRSGSGYGQAFDLVDCLQQVGQAGGCPPLPPIAGRGEEASPTYESHSGPAT